MKNKTSVSPKSLLSWALLVSISGNTLLADASARLIFTTEDDGTNAEAYHIDLDGDGGTAELVFGDESSSAKISFDGTEYSITGGDVDFVKNQAKNFRVQNESGVAPTCDAGMTGGLYFDVTGSDLLFCDGSNWVSTTNITSANIASNSINSSHIIDGTITAADLGTDSVGSDEIATGAVTTAEILDGTVTAADLGTDSVGSDEIATGAVTTAEILDGTITAADLGTDSVGSDEITTGAVTTAEILDGTVTAADLATGSVGTSELASGAVTVDKITGGGVDKVLTTDASGNASWVDKSTLTDIALPSGQLLIGNASGEATGVTISGDATIDASGNLQFGAGSVTSNEIATGAVTTAEILDGTVTAADLGTDSVGSDEITTGAVTTAEILDGTVTAADLGTDSVGSDEITTGAVTTAEILDGTVTAADLGIDSVGSDEITTGAVTTAEILDGTVTAADLGTDSVGSDEITTGAVTTAEILDGTVTAADLGTDSVGSDEITTGAVTTAEILDGTVTAADLGTDSVGSDEIATGAVTTSEILDGTISQDDLANDSVGTDQIKDDAITSDKILDGTISQEDLEARTYEETMAPEFANFTIQADGSNNRGTFESDYDAAANQNYYKWSTGKTALHDYDLIVQWTVPEDFQSFDATTPISFDYKNQGADATVNKIDLLEILDTSDTTLSLTSSNTGLASATWAASDVVFSGGTFTPGETVTLKFRFHSKKSGGKNPSYLGDVRFKYLIK